MILLGAKGCLATCSTYMKSRYIGNEAPRREMVRMEVQDVLEPRSKPMRSAEVAEIKSMAPRKSMCLMRVAQWAWEVLGRERMK